MLKELIEFAHKYGFDILLEVSVLSIFVWSFKSIITKSLNRTPCVECQSFKTLLDAVGRIERELVTIKTYFSMVNFRYKGRDDD